MNHPRPMASPRALSGGCRPNGTTAWPVAIACAVARFRHSLFRLASDLSVAGYSGPVRRSNRISVEPDSAMRDETGQFREVLATKHAIPRSNTVISRTHILLGRPGSGGASNTMPCSSSALICASTSLSSFHSERIMEPHKPMLGAPPGLKCMTLFSMGQM